MAIEFENTWLAAQQNMEENLSTPELTVLVSEERQDVRTVYPPTSADMKSITEV